jgi:hypothetical protein
VNPSALPRGVSKSVVAGAAINGATLPVPVYQNKTDNEFYACDANDTAAMKFLGFAISNGTDGAALIVQFTGIVSGFTGLTEGEKYYVSDTVGTIANTVGTNEVLVGVAISETEILIQKGTRRASGVVTFSSTTTSTITLGFRPSRVRVSAHGESGTGDFVSSTGGFANGTNACAYMTSNDAGVFASGANSSYAWYITRTDGARYHRGTITSVTDTGFTLDNTKLSTVDDVAIYWEAEGEL